MADVQIGKEEYGLIMKELNQLSTWSNEIATYNAAYMALLGQSVAATYEANFDTGEQLVDDNRKISEQIGKFKETLDNLIQTTTTFAAAQAQENSTW